jgi:hypothetical protein
MTKHVFSSRQALRRSLIAIRFIVSLMPRAVDDGMGAAKQDVHPARISEESQKLHEVAQATQNNFPPQHRVANLQDLLVQVVARSRIGKSNIQFCSRRVLRDVMTFASAMRGFHDEARTKKAKSLATLHERNEKMAQHSIFGQHITDEQKDMLGSAVLEEYFAAIDGMKKRKT